MEACAAAGDGAVVGVVGSAERDQRDAADDDRGADQAAGSDALAEKRRREERRDQHAGLSHRCDRRRRREKQRRQHERIGAEGENARRRGKRPCGAAQPLGAVRRREQEADVPEVAGTMLSSR